MKIGPNDGCPTPFGPGADPTGKSDQLNLTNVSRRLLPLTTGTLHKKQAVSP
jgi:hypothetical protein